MFADVHQYEHFTMHKTTSVNDKHRVPYTSIATSTLQDNL